MQYLNFPKASTRQIQNLKLFIYILIKSDLTEIWQTLIFSGYNFCVIILCDNYKYY